MSRCVLGTVFSARVYMCIRKVPGVCSVLCTGVYVRAQVCRCGLSTELRGQHCEPVALDVELLELGQVPDLLGQRDQIVISETQLGGERHRQKDTERERGRRGEEVRERVRVTERDRERDREGEGSS